MDFEPPSAKHCQILGKGLFDIRQIAKRKTVIFSKLDRPIRTIQVEQSLMAVANYMHMLRNVVVGIDNDPQTSYPQYGWQFDYTK
jgi:hypothetical protein